MCAVLGGQTIYRGPACVCACSVRGSEGLHVYRLVLGGQKACMHACV